MSLIQKVSGTINQRSKPGKTPGTLLKTVANMAVKEVEGMIGWRFDPAPSYLFFVELSGIIVGYFTEFSGIEMTRDTEEVRQGGINTHVTYLPGPLTQSKLTLSRGMSVNRQLWDWFMNGQHDLHVKRINMSIVQAAPSHNLVAMTGLADIFPKGAGYGKVRHWDVVDAYPVSYKISDLKTSDVESAVIETLEIAHHGITLTYEVFTPISTVSVALAAGTTAAKAVGADQAAKSVVQSVLK